MSMFPIASTVLNNSQISLTNIPQTFSHLQLRITGRSTGNVATTAYSATGYVRFNGDTGTNYGTAYIAGDGSTAFVGNPYTPNYNTMTCPDLGGPYSGQLANVYNHAIIDIYDYTNTSKTKMMRVLNGMDMNGYGRIFMTIGYWNSTAAITSIGIENDGGTFATGSRVDLYGLFTSNATGV